MQGGMKLGKHVNEYVAMQNGSPESPMSLLSKPTKSIILNMRGVTSPERIFEDITFYKKMLDGLLKFGFKHVDSIKRHEKLGIKSQGAYYTTTKSSFTFHLNKKKMTTLISTRYVMNKKKDLKDTKMGNYFLDNIFDLRSVLGRNITRAILHRREATVLKFIKMMDNKKAFVSDKIEERPIKLP